ncbi:MAG: glycoside hydrolase family 127 protein, partial [Verrucomicrobiae bacterium]|nr:glycoside hydrolase family 127 protein [Verrucomicrobiae bacterium]
MKVKSLFQIQVCVGLVVAITNGASEVSLVDKPEVEPPNEHYPGFRQPLNPSPLIKLPVGVVRPDGWLKRQLELQSEGFHGHLSELSAFLKKENNAWLSPTGEGEHGWEEVPYWLKGFGDCAYLLGKEDQIAEARVWIEAVIRSQRADGYLGPRPGIGSTVSSTTGKYDLWPNMIMLMCLQSYYEFSGDARVLEAMRRYFRWQLSVPEQDFLPPYWQKIRAADNLWSVYWLYNRTGETWLLDLADKIHRHTANFTDGIPDWHNVNMSQAFGGPTFYWLQSKDPRHLQAAERNWQTIRQMYGQVPGGMFGGDENCRPGYTDPRQAIETCGMVEMMFSCERLLNVTGSLVWADRVEDVAFNSFPAALTADMKALRYLTAPNLIQSDRGDKCPGVQNCGPMFHYDPYSHRCCQHNFGHGWPYYVEHAWMATAGNGLAAVIYGPTTVEALVGKGNRVRITERTRYPFDETIVFHFEAGGPVRFPFYLRIPQWCTKAGVKINGRPERISPAPLKYLRIDREWQAGDTVELTLPMEISIRVWTNNHNSVSVDRGPLTYSLRIGEKWVRSGGTDRWPAWEVFPTTPWNYGLVLSEKPAESFEVIRKPWPDDDMPFTPDKTPIELRAKARRIPEWQADERDLVGPLQESPAFSDLPIETVALIPMGAARLRISSFPVVSTGPNAHRWVAPPPMLPYRA